jgi:heme exporter protein C
MKLPRWFHRLGSPPHVFRLAERLKPWFGWIALGALVIGGYWGLALAPEDYRQGDVFRVFYVHVPVALLMTRIYVFMGVAAAIGFIWRLKVAHAAVVSAAPIGASFAFLALVTGAIWGRPTWGTYWEWTDPRILTALIQLFLYLGYMALRAAFEDRDKADKVSAVLAIVGSVNAPIIYYSVEWWTSLHQGPTVTQIGDTPSIAFVMIIPFLFTMLGFVLLFLWLFLHRLQAEIVAREHGARWLDQYLPEPVR